MPYSDINIYQKNVIPINAVLHIVEQDDTLRPDNADAAADPKAIDESKWNLVAEVNTFKVTQETEDDATEAFNADTLTRIASKNTQVKQRGIEFQVVSYPVLFDAIAMGVPNPTSAGTAALLGAGAEDGFPIFANSDPKIPVILRVKKYDNKKNLLQTMYIYCSIYAAGEQEYNGKILQPTLTAEIQPSVWNKAVNTAAFTKQTQSS